MTTSKKKADKSDGVVLQVRLPPDFHARLLRISEAAGYATISEAAREALRDWTARTVQIFSLQDLMETPAPAPQKSPSKAAKKSRE